jgi:DNA-binding CsgD family transcriptional regulator
MLATHAESERRHRSTVQSHVRNIYRRLDVSSEAEAAALAVRRGLVGE